MSLKWITINARLKNGITLINALTTVKFQLLLSHIIKSKGDELFTEEELKKLKDSLKLTEENLQLLIQSITYIYRQASKVVLKPTVLQKHLTENLSFDGEKAEEFVKLWSSETKKDIGDFEHRLKLDKITWELNLETANQISNKQSVPNARVQFNLTKAVDGSQKDKVTIELEETELLQLYTTLEAIQIKLDTINS